MSKIYLRTEGSIIHTAAVLGLASMPLLAATATPFISVSKAYAQSSNAASPQPAPLPLASPPYPPYQMPEQAGSSSQASAELTSPPAPSAPVPGAAPDPIAAASTTAPTDAATPDTTASSAPIPGDETNQTAAASPTALTDSPPPNAMPSSAPIPGDQTTASAEAPSPPTPEEQTTASTAPASSTTDSTTTGDTPSTPEQANNPAGQETAQASASTPKLEELTPKMDTTEPAATPAQASAQPMSTADTIKEAMELTKEHKLTKAADLLEQVVAKDPNNVDAYYDLGAISEDKGDLASALNFYKAASGLAPKDRQIKDAVDSIQKTIAMAAPAGEASPAGAPTVTSADDPSLDGWKRLMRNEHRRQVRGKIITGVAIVLMVGAMVAMAFA